MRLCQFTNSSADVEICGLSSDSREIKSGYLFASLNGDQYIAPALENGAAAVIVGQDFNQELDVPVIKTENPALTFAEAAARFFGKQPENIAAITGTNGKTSIADFIRQILTLMNKKAASMGTLGLIKGSDEPLPYPNTTPNAVTLQRDLNQLAEEGFDYVVMEMSSHGLHQYRAGGVKVKVAGFTNLTQDHFDYHKNFENYLAAKMILFQHNLVADGTAVLNADIEFFPQIEKVCQERGVKIVTYGHKGKELRLIKATPLPHGQRLELEYFGQNMTLEIPLAGEFQAMNVLCALGMTAALTKQPFEVIKYANKIRGAKGRLELVGTYNNAAIYIDYAHTPDAMENVIRALRPHTNHRLCILFGCGGDRDATKRPIMGGIAHNMADEVFVTDDNPRTENAEAIRQQIMAACPKAHNIADRGEAIGQAIAQLQAGDVLILAGKGHETGQYINGKVHPFSDHEQVWKHINKQM